MVANLRSLPILDGQAAPAAPSPGWPEGLTVSEMLTPKTDLQPKRLLLMNPPSKVSLLSWTHYAPTGILSLLACARQAGHEARWIDCCLERMDHAQAKNYIREFQPDYVGFSVLSDYAFDCYRMAGHVKEVSDDIQVIFGNQQATGLDTAILDRLKAVDCIVRGEGELTLVHILDNGITAEIPGITVRGADGTPFRTPERERIKNLDDLPMPGYDMVNHNAYVQALYSERHRHTGHAAFQLRDRAGSIMTSRGCFAKCTFCATPNYWGSTKWFSPERICDVIETLIRDHNVDDYFFFDDIFPPTKGWMSKFQAEVERRNLKFHYACQTRVDQLNEETVRWMRETGCYMIYNGIETGSTKVTESIRKGVKKAEIAQRLQLVADAGINIGAFFIMGFPGEREPDLEDTISLASKLPLSSYYFGVARLLPGSEMLSENPISEHTWFQGYSPAHEGSSPGPEYRSHYDLDHEELPQTPVRVPLENSLPLKQIVRRHSLVLGCRVR